MCTGSSPPKKFQTKLNEMILQLRFARKRLRKAKSGLVSLWLLKYRKCMSKVKKCLQDKNHVEQERRETHAKLQPLPDRPIRRVASKLVRKPTNEVERLRRKEEGTSEERRELCYEWLDRLHALSKKYCYLAWYEAAIYACYYRLGPIITDPEQKRRIWTDVKKEYAQIFLMGRRIWRRASHPNRLRVFYNMATLCVRFGDMPDDSTSVLFRETLADHDNFDYRLLDEVQFAKSVDKITLLENHVIDQFYIRRCSSGSFRSSIRPKRSIERTPSEKSTKSHEVVLPPLSSSSHDQSPPPDYSQPTVSAQPDYSPADHPVNDITRLLDDVALKIVSSDEPNNNRTETTSCLKADTHGDDSVRPGSASQRVVHFNDEEISDVDV
ncbi:hypothetical protein GCK32_015578 [Trichostrongylus colubriformis]|uniref:DUF7758 domain-containing protein n=1 Tax=Trichostrongylus colubriformis TaxID=6319 RepID=A0AAN8FX55_TRICO